MGDPSRISIRRPTPSIFFLFLRRSVRFVSCRFARSKDKKKAFRQQNRRSVSKFIWPRLADLRAQETAVIFYSHSAAAE